MCISVVIPIYGCRAALNELYERTSKTLRKIADEYEIILVDDHCPQHSWEEIERICAGDTRVKGIQLSRNWGQMKAITAGIDESKGDWVVVMDCDLQDSPEDIEKLYHMAQTGYDIVFSRRAQRHDNRVKIWISKCFYKVYSWMCDDLYDSSMSNFCIFSRQVADEFCKLRELHRAFTIYLKWLGFRQTIIDVQHNDRKEGKTSYTFKKRFKLAFDIILSQSDKLLRAIVGIGVGVSAASLLFAIVMVSRYFIYDIKAGWTSIIVAICGMGGLILVAIGCIGIYVGNIFMQSKQRPLYIIRKTLN